MTNVVKLNSLDEHDEEYSNFIDELKNDVVSAIFLIEKSDGTVQVGSNFENRRDLVYAIYRLQQLGQVLAAGGDE
jgi:hypothetical protein